MAMPKKRSRLITVDGHRLRWCISFSRNCPFYRLVTIVVEHADSPGSRLIVYPIGVDVNYVDYDRGEPFTPVVVARLIEAGFTAGWRPGDPSGNVVLGDRSDDPSMNSPCIDFTSTTSLIGGEVSVTHRGKTWKVLEF